MLDLGHIAAAPVATEPFPYFVASDVLGTEALERIEPLRSEPHAEPLAVSLREREGWC